MPGEVNMLCLPILIKPSLFSRIWRILFDFHEMIDYE